MDQQHNEACRSFPGLNYTYDMLCDRCKNVLDKMFDMIVISYLPPVILVSSYDMKESG